MSIIVGVDGSPQSWEALEWACDEARDRRQPLRIVHIGDDPLVLREAEARTGADIDTSTHLAKGDPGKVLVAESERAEVVIVASHGHSRMHDTFIGSVSQHTAMHARCPVIVIRPYQSRTPERVVVGVDGSPLSKSAVVFAFAEARRLGTGVTAIHTWVQPVASGHDSLVPLATDLEALQHENEALLSESLAGTISEHPDVDVRQITLQSTAGAALIEASLRARLLVVGSHGRNPVAGLLLGSTSQAVLHHAGSPVAITHLPRTG